MSYSTRKSGFTFLEVLVALSLFAVGMISVLAIFPVNRRFLLQSANTTQAVELAQEKLEQVRALTYNDLTVGAYEAAAPVTADTTNPLSQYTRQTTVTLLDGNRQTTNTDQGLKKVDVQVSWKEHGANRQYTLSTYVAQ